MRLHALGSLLVGCLLSSVAMAGMSYAPGTVGPQPIADSILASGLFACGTRTLVHSSTGPRIDVTRVSDLSVQTFSAHADGQLSLSALNAFLLGTTGYITKCYDQFGSNNHATQPVLASAPRIDPAFTAGGAPAIIADYGLRKYLSGLTTYPVTSFAGAVITMTNPIPSWWAPGMTVAGTNLASTTISAINFAGNTITVAIGPTGAAGDLTITVPNIWMDLPSSLGVTYNNHSMFFVERPAPLQANVNSPIVLGVSAATALGAGTSYSGLYISTNGALDANLRLIGQTGLRFFVPNSLFMPHDGVNVYGYTRNGTAVNFWAEDFTLSGNTSSNPGSGILSGGSLFFTQQFTSGSFGGDAEFYGAAVYGSALSAAQVASLRNNFSAGFAVDQSIRNTIIFDGSSTTLGRGAPFTNSISRRVSDLLSASYPNRTYNVGFGASIEYENYHFSDFVQPVCNPSNANVLVYWAGLGNSLQASGTYTITGQVGSVLTTSTSIAIAMMVPGAFVSGTNVQAGTSVTAVNTTTGEITLSLAPSGTVTSLTIENDTGAQAWSAVSAYLSNARALCPGIRILLVGSTARGTFTAGQLTQFNVAKGLERANWPSVADAYLDLQDTAQFAGDTPWVANPTYFYSDQQHFTDVAQSLQASLIRAALVSSRLLQ